MRVAGEQLIGERRAAAEVEAAARPREERYVGCPFGRDERR